MKNKKINESKLYEVAIKEAKENFKNVPGYYIDSFTTTVKKVKGRKTIVIVNLFKTNQEDADTLNSFTSLEEFESAYQARVGVKEAQEIISCVTKHEYIYTKH